jgi:hypothetical protein
MTCGAVFLLLQWESNLREQPMDVWEGKEEGRGQPKGFSYGLGGSFIAVQPRRANRTGSARQQPEEKKKYPGTEQEYQRVRCLSPPTSSSKRKLQDE